MHRQSEVDSVYIVALNNTKYGHLLSLFSLSFQYIETEIPKINLKANYEAPEY